MFDEGATYLLTWFGIVFCLSQAAMFSGLNLAVFSVGRLRLEVEATLGNPQSITLLKWRDDSNLTLTTILWGNVAANVLLTLLSDSVLAGFAAFLFSTFVITIIGEVVPQAYFSRHALAIVSTLTPILRIYSVLLFPLAKPTALLLDWWIGSQGPLLYREREIRELIRKHLEVDEAEIDRVEGLGAINFLALDDIPVREEGEIIDPESIIELPMSDGRPVFPPIRCMPSDPFLMRLDRSGRKWIVITDLYGSPHFVINSDAFLRDALFTPEAFHPLSHCHRPAVVRDPDRRLGSVIGQLNVQAEYPGDNVIDFDVILVWGKEKRVITGADILGQLMSGLVTVTQPREWRARATPG